MGEKTTSLPWEYDGHEYYNDFGGRYREIVGADDEQVIGEYAYLSDLDAAFIVRAVNSHAALLAALKRLLAGAEGNASEHETGCRCVIHEALAAIAEAEKP